MDKFSVLMSVYNKEQPEYLDQSLESIFNQTIKPSEVVLVEDGKLTKELDLVVEKYQKKYSKKLIVIMKRKNKGLGIALHDGLLECSNEIIFRMDSDDVCIFNRFEKQLEIFKNKDIDVVGANIAEYDINMENELGKRVVPELDEKIKKVIKKRNPLNHMTVAYKKSKVIEAGNYQDMLFFEDYYLWARMVGNDCKFYNIQEVLVNARGGKDIIKRRGGKKYIKPIINFEKKLLELKIINRFRYIINVSTRIIGALVPNGVRVLLYKKYLKNK